MISWETLEKEIKKSKIRDLSGITKEYFDLDIKISDMIHEKMGIPEEEFEKVLQEAEKMMEPFDPNKTYRNRFEGYFIENASMIHYKDENWNGIFVN